MRKRAIIKPSKIFGGRRYKFFNSYPTKTGADRVAKAIREYRPGNLARVVKAPKKLKNNWLVYANRRGQ